MTSKKHASGTAKKTNKALGKKAHTANVGGAPIQAATHAVEPEQRMIEVAAYYRAERRGFQPGAELDDWLQAEAEIRGQAQS